MSNVIAKGISSTLKTDEKEQLLSNINAVSSSADTAKIIASGSATFTNSTNNIALTGIGKDVEVGDVIQISGATNAKNNSEFTVEVITNDNSIIVNQAHAGKTSSKALVSETANVTVRLLCKWYLAPIGLGQGWVGVGKVINQDYPNSTKRIIQTCWTFAYGSTRDAELRIDSARRDIQGGDGTTGVFTTVQGLVPSGSIYRVVVTAGTLSEVNELR